MTTFSNSALKRNSRSAWPMVLAMLSCVAVVFVPLLGSAIVFLVPVFALGTLTYFVLLRLSREARTKARELPDTGELPYGFAGHEIRAFSDGDGQVWLRARDVRHALGLERTDKWMARAYPAGYRRAHPRADSWFIHPETVRRHWGGSMRIDVNRFIHWMERELVPLQQKRAALVREGGHAAEDFVESAEEQRSLSPIRALTHYLGSHWRGEHHFLQIALSGGVLALLISHVLLTEPAFSRPGNSLSPLRNDLPERTAHRHADVRLVGRRCLARQQALAGRGTLAPGWLGVCDRWHDDAALRL